MTEAEAEPRMRTTEGGRAAREDSWLAWSPRSAPGSQRQPRTPEPAQAMMRQYKGVKLPDCHRDWPTAGARSCCAGQKKRSGRRAAARSAQCLSQSDAETVTGEGTEEVGVSASVQFHSMSQDEV